MVTLPELVIRERSLWLIKKLKLRFSKYNTEKMAIRKSKNDNVHLVIRQTIHSVYKVGMVVWFPCTYCSLVSMLPGKVVVGSGCHDLELVSVHSQTAGWIQGNLQRPH